MQLHPFRILLYVGLFLYLLFNLFVNYYAALNYALFILAFVIFAGILIKKLYHAGHFHFNNKKTNKNASETLSSIQSSDAFWIITSLIIYVETMLLAVIHH